VGFISWMYDKAARLVEANWEAIEALAAARTVAVPMIRGFDFGYSPVVFPVRPLTLTLKVRP
jgi:hypothetical protein